MQTLHYSHLHLTGETCCFLEKMPPKKKKSQKDVLFKSKLTLQTVKFATPKEIIQYFLFLRQSRGTGVTTSHLEIRHFTSNHPVSNKVTGSTAVFYPS